MSLYGFVRKDHDKKNYYEDTDVTYSKKHLESMEHEKHTAHTDIKFPKVKLL